MKLTATVLAAAALCVTTGTAQAQVNGTLTCQIGLSQFAEDVYTSKTNLRPGQVATAAKLIELSRSQCRSSPGIVSANLQAARQDMRLATGRAGRVPGIDDFWPASPQELSMLTGDVPASPSRR